MVAVAAAGHGEPTSPTGGGGERWGAAAAEGGQRDGARRPQAAR